MSSPLRLFSLVLVILMAPHCDAALVNLFSSPDGSGLASTGSSTLTISVGDSPTTPGSGNEAIIAGDPPNFSGKIRHASLSGASQGLLVMPSDAETFKLSYEIYVPSANNFRRDNPFVRFYEPNGIFMGGSNQELQGFGQGGNNSVVDQWQMVEYTGNVPTTFNANYVEFSIQFEQNGDSGNDGNISVFLRNVSFDVEVTAVPEPSSLAMLGLASVAGLVSWRRRRVN